MNNSRSNGFLLVAGALIFCLGLALPGPWAIVTSIIAIVCGILWFLTTFGFIRIS